MSDNVTETVPTELDLLSKSKRVFEIAFHSNGDVKLSILGVYQFSSLLRATLEFNYSFELYSITNFIFENISHEQ